MNTLHRSLKCDFAYHLPAKQRTRHVNEYNLLRFNVVCHLLPKLGFIFQMTGVPRPGSLRSVLCEGTDLDQYVQFNSQAEKEAFQNASCSLTPQQLINTQQVLLQNLNARKVLSEVSVPCRRLHTTNKSNWSLIKLEVNFAF